MFNLYTFSAMALILLKRRPISQLSTRRDVHTRARARLRRHQALLLRTIWEVVFPPFWRTYLEHLASLAMPPPLPTALLPPMLPWQPVPRVPSCVMLPLPLASLLVIPLIHQWIRRPFSHRRDILSFLDSRPLLPTHRLRCSCA